MATFPEIPEIDAIFVFFLHRKAPFLFQICIQRQILSLERPFVNNYLLSFLAY
jgi:hypothetical protein